MLAAAGPRWNGSPELARYPEDQQIYNAALLIEDGYLRGEALQGNQGRYITAVLEDLTSRGHDFLEQMEREFVSSDHKLINGSEQKDAEMKTVSVFISHSNKDKPVAAALIDLLRTAIGLGDDEIRCSSVDGYRFEVGAETDAQLKKEVKGCKVFIGLITPSSIQSAYVLFELGARWGADLHLAPILACGATSELLKGPLGGLNALNGTSEGEVHQLIRDVGSRLDRQAANAAVYGKMLKLFVLAASTEDKAIPPPAVRPSNVILIPEIPKQIVDDILRITAERSEITAEAFSHRSGQSIVRSQFYLTALEEEDFLEEHFRTGGSYFELAHKGRAYVIAENLDKQV